MSDKYKVAIDMPPLPTIEGETELSLFDPNNPDLNLFNIIDDETIRLSGSKLQYYKYFQSEGTVDAVYMEERDKVVHSEPVEVFGHYNPTAIEENLTQFGIELTNDQLFVFNKSSIEFSLGRRPIPHDIIKPKFQNVKYEIFEVQEESFEIYGVYHIICASRILRDSLSTVDTPVKQSEGLSRRPNDPRIGPSPLSTKDDQFDPYGEK